MSITQSGYLSIAVDHVVEAGGYMAPDETSEMNVDAIYTTIYIFTLGVCG